MKLRVYVLFIVATMVAPFSARAAGLTLTLPQTTYEGAGVISGAVSIETPAASDVEVALTSDNPSGISGKTVTVPAGENTALFQLTVKDNRLIDGVQTVVMTARAAGYADGRAPVFIFDDETTELKLDCPARFTEGEGMLTNSGTVSLSGIAVHDLNILLTCSDTTEIEIPQLITIPAGESNAVFSISVVDDTELDGRQELNIRADLFDFVPAKALLSVADNDVHHFAVQGLEGLRPAYCPVSASFLAVDVNGEVIPSYTGSFSVSAGTVAVESDLPMVFSEGQWSGVLKFGGVGENLPFQVEDGAGHIGTVELDIFAANVIKMAADQSLPYVYMLHTGTDSAKASALLWYNTELEAIEDVKDAGTKANDFSVHYADNLIYVSANGISAVQVIDRGSRAKLDNLVLHNYVYRIGAGPSGMLMTEDDGIGNAYYCKLHLWNNTTGAQIQQSANYSIGRGTGESDPSGRFYYHADTTAYPYTGLLRKYDLSSGRMVQVKSAGITKGSRRELVVSDDGTRLFYNNSTYDSDLNRIGAVGEAVYAASLHGELAVSTTKVLNSISGGLFYTLPFTSTAMAFVPDQSRLLLFNASSNTLAAVDTVDMIPTSFPAMTPTPAAGAVEGATLSEISWSGSPVAFAYDVYIGTDSNAVASATTNSAEYTGRQIATTLSMPEGYLKGSESYFWRIDQIGFGGTVSAGELWDFHTPAIAIVPDEIEAYAIAAAYTQTVSIAIESFVDGPAPWSASCPSNWLTFASNGIAPAMLDIHFDAGQLAAGVHTTEIEITDGSRSITVPVSIEVEKMRIVKMVTDWTLPYVYMAHTGATGSKPSKLIWYNTDTDRIERVLDAGENATDLTVHYADNRIYMSNWQRAQTRVFDRSAKTELDPLLLGSDVYHINAGAVDRVITEGEDQWVRMSMRNTTNSSEVSYKYTVREGDAESTLDGRFHYHCDNNSSGATIQKYDMTADTFAQVASKRTKYYYGSRNIFLSMDGTRVYNCGTIYDGDLKELLDLKTELYAASAYGDLVLSATKAFNGVNGEEIYTLPFSTRVMAFSGNQSDLILFNPTSGSITSLATSVIMPIPEPNMIPVPAVGSLQGDNLPELAWSGAPAAIGYDVYIGTDSNAVASASTNGVQYLGRMTDTEIQLLESSLAGNQTYFWRVDIVAFGNEIVKGDMWNFKTASISVDPYGIVVDGVTATYTQKVSVAVNNSVGTPVSWTVECTNDWVLLGASGGTGTGSLEVGVDMSGLEPGIYTAEVRFNDGDGTLVVPVTLSVEKMRLVKMATDWTLPYVYMAHSSAVSPYKARLIWYNTDTDSIEHVVDAGENITDLTVSYADNRIYVSNWKRTETRVFDRSSKSELDSLALGGDVYKINAAGAGRIITEGEDQWITVTMRDAQTSASIASRGEREGDGDCTLDGRYYYHTDNNSSGARLSRFAVTNDAFASEISIKTKSYYGSRNVFVSMDGSRVYNCSTVYDADLREKLYLGAEIYAASAYGDLVLTGSKAFNGVSGEAIYTLPFSSSVMAFSGDQSELLLYNSTSGSITSLATSVIMPIPEPNMIPVPAIGSIQGANLPGLAWTGAPAAIGYDVYLGTDSNAVAVASTNHIEYLGRNTDTNFPLPEGALTGNETYYWRVDIVAFGNTIVGGEVWSFDTASIAVDPYVVIVDGVAAGYTQTVSVAVNRAVGSSIGWTASCTNNWVLLGATNGTASGTLELGFDFSGLPAGKHMAEIKFSDGARTLAVPVELSVENMRIVKMATDWTKPYVYMAHTSATSPNKSRLIWYNTETETIEHVVDAGENATDLTVHYGEDRIYVNNWKRTETRVFDRSSRLELEPLLLGGDVYHINAGATGRVITEGEDQWVRMSMRNTTNSSEVAYKYTVREGDADSTLDGRYHYHCDNNSSGATIQKYDMAADTFAQVASRRTKYYYGSRNIFVSMDGSRVFNCGTIYDADLVELKNLAVELYAATSDGGLVSSAGKVFNSASGEELMTLPFSSTVMAVSYDNAKLVGYVASSGQLEVADISGLALPEATDYLAWQAQYFPDADENDICSSDDDHDGQCNLAEYIAGTDPTEADSCFMMYDAVPLEDGRLVIYWDAVSNRIYNVNYAPSLAAPFQSLETGIRYPQNSYTDSVDRAESSGFYRIGVQKEN